MKTCFRTSKDRARCRQSNHILYSIGDNKLLTNLLCRSQKRMELVHLALGCLVVLRSYQSHIGRYLTKLEEIVLLVVKLCWSSKHSYCGQVPIALQQLHQV